MPTSDCGRRVVRTTVAALFATACGSPRHQSTPHEAVAVSSSVVIENVRLFDGDSIVPRATVVLAGSRIAAVGPGVRVPSMATIVDGGGRTLLPGLIDSHVHYNAPHSLRQALAFGVTTELDMGGDVRQTSEAKRLLSVGALPDGADLFSAGTQITAPGGHGTEYGVRIPTLRADDDVQGFVDARIAEGADYIKIIYDDGSTYTPLPTLGRDVLGAAIRAAHLRSRRAIVHIATLREARDAVEAGADGLAHLFVDHPGRSDFVASARANGGFIVPTLVVMERIARVANREDLLADSGIVRYLSPSDEAALRRSFPVRPAVPVRYTFAEETLRALRDARVPLLAGSDAGIVHGVLLLREVELLVRAGLTPVQALRAATSAPADAFGLSDRGRIRAGLRADLVLVDGDPTADPLALRRIARVWKAGLEVNRAAFADSLAAVKEADARQRAAAPPPGSALALVSDFESGSPTVSYGSGWRVTTDSVSGGNSQATMTVTNGGAAGSQRSLRVEGEVRAGRAFGWAGAQFIPYTAPARAANLSAKRQISFWARGDGGTYAIQISARSYGFVPASQTFVAGPEWKQYHFDLKDFDGMDGHDLTGVVFAAGPAPRRFSFQIDKLELR